MVFTKEWHWTEVQTTLPNIKEDFELCIINLKMCGYSEAYVHINGGSYKKNSNRIKVKKCHIYLKERQKIFTFYYDAHNNLMYYRYRKDPLNESLKRTNINDINELKEKLINIVLEL